MCVCSYFLYNNRLIEPLSFVVRVLCGFSLKYATLCIAFRHIDIHIQYGYTYAHSMHI